MFKYGSIIYVLFFVVSFLMVYRLDEKPDESWTLSRICLESLAAGMLVIYLLDF